MGKSMKRANLFVHARLRLIESISHLVRLLFLPFSQLVASKEDESKIQIQTNDFLSFRAEVQPSHDAGNDERKLIPLPAGPPLHLSLPSKRKQAMHFSVSHKQILSLFTSAPSAAPYFPPKMQR